MSQIPSTLKEKRRFRLSHLEAWRDSGLSMVGYARQAGISSKSLGYWHGKTRHESASAATTQRPRLLPVSVAATTAPDTSEPSANSEDVLELDPLSSHLFVFCNRRRDKLKLLFWQHNGFWLWYRRLETQRFWWPNTDDDTPCIELSLRELGWLLDGLDLSRVEAHRRADFSLI